MRNKYYCGIGSRQTPLDIQNQMGEIAKKLSGLGYTLRSGHAVGADQAFGNYAEKAEIWLPWKSFNSAQKVAHHTYKVISLSDKDAFDSLKFHPFGDKLLASHRLLMARNYRQIIGDNAPNSEFVICWTSDGKDSGGTGQAIRIATAHNIPVYNLFYKESYEYIKNSYA